MIVKYCHFCYNQIIAPVSVIQVTKILPRRTTGSNQCRKKILLYTTTTNSMVKVDSILTYRTSNFLKRIIFTMILWLMSIPKLRQPNMLVLLSGQNGYHFTNVVVSAFSSIVLTQKKYTSVVVSTKTRDRIQYHMNYKHFSSHHQRTSIYIGRSTSNDVRRMSTRGVVTRQCSQNDSLADSPTIDTSISTKATNCFHNRKNSVAIVGGGLAGLSTTYHYLSKVLKQKQELRELNQGYKITIFDVALVGEYGASSVAGGLLHPLSPSGDKIVHWGIEGLHSTNELVTAAIKAVSLSTSTGINKDDIIVRDELYRLVTAPASTTTPTKTDTYTVSETKSDTTVDADTKDDDNEIHMKKKKKTKKKYFTNDANQVDQQIESMKLFARLYPNIAEWVDVEQLPQSLVTTSAGTKHYSDSNSTSVVAAAASSGVETNDQQIVGGLRLHKSCMVLHVPSYLTGLYLACQHIIDEINAVSGAGTNSAIEWCIDKSRNSNVDDDSVNIIGKNNSHSVNDYRKQWMERLKDYDTVVFTAGSGMFHQSTETATGSTTTTSCSTKSNTTNNMQTSSTSSLPMFQPSMLPISLVLGQSLILNQPSNDDTNSDRIAEDLVSTNEVSSNTLSSFPAILCGKYVTPIPRSIIHNNNQSNAIGMNRILIGATHEFRINEPMSKLQVISELHTRTKEIARPVWNSYPTALQLLNDETIEITVGIRVQSNRGQFGRMPIIGRLPRDDAFDNNENKVKQRMANRNVEKAVSSTTAMDPAVTTALDNGITTANSNSNIKSIHHNAWIFTGLSSRGLLYHALYGDILTDAILSNNEDDIIERCEHLLWWKNK